MCCVCGKHPRVRRKDPWGKWERISDLRPAAGGKLICSACLGELVRDTVVMLKS